MPVGTWNMQGANHEKEQKWSLVLLRLIKDGYVGANVVCVQECGGVPTSARPIRNLNGVEIYAWNGHRYRETMQIAHAVTDHGGHRCNLAVLTTNDRNIFDAMVVTPAGHVHRPAIGVDIEGFGWVFTLHARPVAHNDALALINAIDLAVGPQPWIAAGDFNLEAGDVHNLPPGVIVRHGGPTWNAHDPTARRTYDYFVMRGWDETHVARRMASQFSDHFPVVFEGSGPLR